MWSDGRVTADWFQRLYHGVEEGCLEVRCLPPTVGQDVRRNWFDLAALGQIEEAIAYAGQQNQAGYDVFFGVNPRVLRGSTADSVLRAVAVWVDVDGIGDRNLAAAHLEQMRNHPVKPDLAVFSGGGLHAYWVLSEPVDPADPEIRLYKRALHANAHLWGGDRNACDLARVLRFPGTISHKRGVPTGWWLA